MILREAIAINTAAIVNPYSNYTFSSDSTPSAINTSSMYTPNSIELATSTQSSSLSDLGLYAVLTVAKATCTTITSQTCAMPLSAKLTTMS